MIDFAEPHGSFCFTCGDGFAGIDLRALIAHRRDEGRKATVAAEEPTGRHGALKMTGSNTPSSLNPSIPPVETDQVTACCHDDFWQPLDTLHDKKHLEPRRTTGMAPWKTW